MATKRYVGAKIKTGYWMNSKDEKWAKLAKESYLKISQRPTISR